MNIVLRFFLHGFIDVLSEVPNIFSLILFKLIHFFSNEETKVYWKSIIKEFENNGKFSFVMKKTIGNLSFESKKKFINNVLINYLIVGPKVRNSWKKVLGFKPPSSVAISPSMACNLKCKGCFNLNFEKTQSLSDKDIDKVLDELKQLGAYMAVVLGGEPFANKKKLFRMLEVHSDMFFIIYTNGTLIDTNTAISLSKLGNCQIGFSVEGFEKETDKRRGKGTFDKVINGMELLKSYGVMFSFSATFSKENAEVMLSEEFIDFYVEQGCTMGWFFQYMPINGELTTENMATPKQRMKLRAKVKEWRETKEIAFIDFQNDGEKIGGCIGGGKRYFNINADGWAEPCTFAHFATHNIKEYSIIDILKSEFFVKWRKLVDESDGNYLRPCSVLDSPKRLRTCVRDCQAEPTHEGAENIIKTPAILEELDIYSADMKNLTNEMWSNGMKEESQKKYKDIG